MEKVSIRSTNLFFPVYLLSYVGVSYVVAIFLRNADLPMWQLIALSDCILIAPVLVFLIIKKANPLSMEHMRLAKISDMIRAVFYAYSLLPLMALINLISMNFVENPVDEMLESISNYSLGARLCLMAVMPAVVEEFIFRGVFVQAYRRRNVLIAAIMSGLIFGLIHLNVSQCAYAVMMGIAFTLINEASGSIMTSMIAHFAINANSVILTFLEERFAAVEDRAMMMQETEELAGGNGSFFFLYIVLAVFACAGVAIAIVLLRGVAKHNGRVEYMANVFKQGFRPNEGNAERFVDAFLLAGIAIAVAIIVLGL